MADTHVIGSLRCRCWLAILIGIALVPRPLEAHLVTTGLGPVYDGISHLFVSPDDLLPVLTMALLAGLNGAAAARRTLFALTGAWLIGGMAGLIAGGALIPTGLAAVSFLVIGGLTAVDVPLSRTVVTWIAVIFGIVHGWLNGTAIAAAGRDGLGLAGIVAATFVLVALAAAAVVALSARAAGARLAVRVAGSWVAAIGLLMIGWSLRG